MFLNEIVDYLMKETLISSPFFSDRNLFTRPTIFASDISRIGNTCINAMLSKTTKKFESKNDRATLTQWR